MRTSPLRDDADVAQLAEQPPRKWQVASSNLAVGSTANSPSHANGGVAAERPEGRPTPPRTGDEEDLPMDGEAS